MDTEFSDFRSIELLEDESHNIVIFPKSKSDRIDKNGNIIYRSAYYPIELIYPYTIDDLEQKIIEAFDSWNKYDAYFFEDEKITIEEKFYKVKGFKNASKGKKYIQLGWNDIMGKNAMFGVPLNKGYGYIFKKIENLSSNASYEDFAKVVIKLLGVKLV